MSAAPFIGPSADIDRQRYAERAAAELEHVGNWLDDFEWFERSEVQLEDLACPEVRAIHAARAVVGDDCRNEDGRCDLRTLAGEIERRDDLLNEIRLAEGPRGYQAIAARLAEIQVDRGTIGQERRLSRRIRSRVREDRIAALYRRGATGQDVFDEIAELRGEIEAINGPAPSARVADRFNDWSTSVRFVFDTPPKPREFLVHDFMPASESGLLVARGGAGKGHFQQALNLPLALGESFAGFKAGRPRGVVMVSQEDDREEIHRRMYAALAARLGTDDPRRILEAREAIEKRIRIVDLRGVTGIGLGKQLRERLMPVVELVEDPGLVWLDPVSRLLPPGSPPGFLNSQEGAGLVLAEFDALRTATGCSVIGAHHVNKTAIREDGELKGGSPTGSQLLADLSRWVLGMKPLTPDEAAEYGLRDGHFLEAAVIKSNYTPPIDGNLVFKRVAGGALVHVEAKAKSDTNDQAMLAALMKGEQWLTREQWLDRAADLSKLSKHAANDARARLLEVGSVAQHEVREGKRFKMVFAPAQHIRLDRWPAPPTRLNEIEEPS